MWIRKRGELLRPDAWTQAEVDRVWKQCVRPDAETLYQQNPSSSEPLTEECFRLITTLPPSTAPVVISIDCALTDSPRSSYSVASVWCPQDGYDVVLDLVRARCKYKEFCKAVRCLISRYRPSRILIEKTASGPALLDDLCQHAARFGSELVGVPRPNRDNNTRARIAPYLKYIRSGGIRLPARADFVAEFISEFVDADAESDDIVASTSQYFDDRKKHPTLKPPAPARVVGVYGSRGTAHSVAAASSIPGLGVIQSLGAVPAGPNSSTPWGMPTPIETNDTLTTVVYTPDGPRTKRI